jgi:chemotaxis protein CheX
MANGISNEELVQAIRRATEEVFSTMLGLEAVPQEFYIERTAPGPAEGVVSLIGLAGAWVGTGSISCSANFALTISSHLLMTEYQAVNEEVLDAVAEVTNMIIGNVKTVIEEKLGGLGLSIPTVIYGRNFTTRSVGNGEWVVAPFLCQGERMAVQLCLAPNRGETLLRPGVANPQMAPA